MSIIWTIIIGLIVGVIARLLLPGKEAISSGALGWLITALIGIAGAFLGTFIGGSVVGRRGLRSRMDYVHHRRGHTSADLQADRQQNRRLKIRQFSEKKVRFSPGAQASMPALQSGESSSIKLDLNFHRT